MTVDFEELAFRATPLGELSLRRRMHLALGVEVYEVKLGDEFLMSSLFTAGEIALAELALNQLGSGPLDVVVGGLGLGYTAHAVLQRKEVRSLLVVDALPDVIDWHRRGLVPLGDSIAADPRCTLMCADFFACAASAGFDARTPAQRYHAILLDIDHSPQHVLHPSNESFYRREGLRLLAHHLHPGGLFGLWSNDPPDDAFGVELGAAFDRWDARVVTFHNPLQDRDATNTIYLARTAKKT
jgi:spermidine synthase